jgi:hypothetical protein
MIGDVGCSRAWEALARLSSMVIFDSRAEVVLCVAGNGLAINSIIRPPI